jgi:hypothetical protein
MYSLSRSTLNYVLTTQIYTKIVYLLSTYTLKLLNLRVLPPTRRKTGRASHLHHSSLTPFSSSPSLFFFSNYYDIFGWISVLYRRGNPSVAAHSVRGPAAAKGHGARPLTPRRRVLHLGHARGPLLAAPSAVAHSVMSLTPCATMPDVYFC